MDTESWQKVEQIFHQAIQRPVADRPALIRRLAGDDSAIADEVKSLIANYKDDDWLDLAPSDDLSSALQHAMDLLSGHCRPEKAGATQGSEVRRPEYSEHELSRIIESLDGRFEYRGLVGRGGMGTVAHAFDRSLKRSVAIKLIPERHLDPSTCSRILRESQSIAQIHSDHIVPIYQVGNDPLAPYLVMELIRGPSLKALIMRRRRLPPRFVAEIARQVAVGLSDAHAQSLIHRDIKPANILLQRQKGQHSPWRAKIIDFGLAQTTGGTERSLDHVFAGTPPYMSPEQLLRPQTVDERSDIYSLGATLYTALTGEPPFRGAPHMIARQIESREPIAPRQFDDRIPRDLESICLKAIAKEPAARYRAAADMAADLQRFLRGEPTIARPVAGWEKLYRWTRRNRRLAAALAGVVLLLGILVVGSLASASILWRQNVALDRQQQQTNQALCARIANAEPETLPVAIAQLRDQMDQPVVELRKLWNSSRQPRERINLACAMTALGADYIDFILERIPDVATSPGQCKTVCAALSQQAAASLTSIHKRFAASDDVDEQVKLAIVALDLGDFSLVAQITQPDGSPNQRTEFIHRLATWHGELNHLLKIIDSDSPSQVAMAVCLGLGLIDPHAFTVQQHEQLRQRLESLYAKSSKPEMRSAAGWLMRRNGWMPVSSIQGDRSIPGLKTGLGFEMIPIQAGEFQMGNSDSAVQYSGRQLHPVRLTRDFCIADREVSVGLYRTFLADADYPAGSKPNDFASWQPDEVISPTSEHPAQQVSWLDAVAFCNWLSHRKGFQPCYVQRDKATVAVEHGKTLELEIWERDESANGFRLPSEAEWEFAARAGTETAYSFGDSRRYLEFYGAWSNNRRVACETCGWLMPNRGGLFDVHGNVWEWTDDWMREFPDSLEVDPRSTTPNASGLVYRGGGICTYSGDPQSSGAVTALPTMSYNNLGFRVVRNADQRLPATTIRRDPSQSARTSIDR